MKSYLLIITFVFIGLTGVASAERFDQTVIEGVYQGCVDEAAARGNLNDTTKAQCRCATNVFKDNVTQSDWDSLEQYYKAGKPFEEHPKIQELLPQIIKCAS